MIFQNVQNPGEFLQKLFDQNITIDDGVTGFCRAKKIAFNYNILKLSTEKENCVLSNLLLNIQKYPWEGHKLLTHPLLESFILAKWQKVKKYFNGQALLTLVFVLCLSVMNTMKLGRELREADKVHPSYFLIPLIPLFLEILLFELFLFMYEWKQWREKFLLLTTKFIAIILVIANLASFIEWEGSSTDGTNDEDKGSSEDSNGDDTNAKWDRDHAVYRHVKRRFHRNLN